MESGQQPPAARVFPLPCSDPTKWAAIEQHLKRPIPDHNTLNAVVHSLFALRPAQERRGVDGDELLLGLTNAIRFVEDSVSWCGDFFSTLLPRIVDHALEMPRLFGGVGDSPENFLRVLDSGTAACVRLSHEQARCLLAHSFFCSLGTVQGCGDISMMGLYQVHAGVGVERAKCLLNFFVHACSDPNAPAPRAQTTNALMQGRLEFHRLVQHTPTPWADLIHTPLGEVEVAETGAVEEAVGADSVVDFANKRLQIFCNIPSATQEEVLFSIIPECMLGLLFCEEMKPNECIIIKGAHRYSRYSGYLHSFEFAGTCSPLPSPNVPDVVAIDALMGPGRQFTKEGIDRDLNKAWLGFSNVAGTPPRSGVVSTGLWGCGVFGGHPYLKFLQQWMAASAHGRPMRFATFGHRQLTEELTELYAFLKGARWTVARLYESLLRCKDIHVMEEFVQACIAR